MTTVRVWPGIQGTLVWLAVLTLAIRAAEIPKAEVERKPSTYAPAKDLEAQVQFFLDRIKNELKAESTYDEESVQRVTRDANTLTVLALVLGKHDEANKYQSSATILLDRSLHLAEKSQDRAEAQRSYDQLVEANSNGASPAALEWKSVGNIAEIMNQVPTLNTRLRGHVRNADRFEKTQKEAAGLAATLAAIAHVSLFDDSYCSDPADREGWIELCGLMRDAAYDINQAVHRGDRTAAVDGLKPLTRTCDDCHEQFKD